MYRTGPESDTGHAVPEETGWGEYGSGSKVSGSAVSVRRVSLRPGAANRVNRFSRPNPPGGVEGVATRKPLWNRPPDPPQPFTGRTGTVPPTPTATQPTSPRPSVGRGSGPRPGRMGDRAGPAVGGAARRGGGLGYPLGKASRPPGGAS